jgi:ERCC4-type nuclease
VSISLCRELAMAMRTGAAREADVSILVSLLLDGGVLDAAEAAMGDDLDASPLLVDTREQDPFGPFLWQKGKRVPLPPEFATLAEGDYTTPALAPFVRIERKSLGDLYGTLYGTGVDALGEAAPNQDRFRRELHRLSAYPRAFLVVEGQPRDFVEHIIKRRRRVDPAAAVQNVEALAFDYGVPVRWCNGREGAEWFTGYTLSRASSQATDKREAKKARERGLDLAWALKEEGDG